MWEALVLKYATQYSVDQNLITAIIEVESNGRALCMRYEPQLFTQYSQLGPLTDEARALAKLTNTTYETEMILRASSLGAMQVLGQVARELGHKGPLLDLCVPEVGVAYGVKKLAELKNRFHSWEPDIISGYNAGTPRKKSTGEYFNQAYVNSVNMVLTRLRGTHS